MKFTTSWDDGYMLDLKLADLLSTYGCKGTFYVCPRKQHGHEMLSKSDIVSLQEKHEIGAHTLRHSRLTEISPIEAKAEIVDSKAWVEDITETHCTMFCYPYGFYNNAVKEMVHDAGYKGARTTERLQFAIDDSFAMPTTLQVTPFPKRKIWSRWWHPLDPYGPLRVRKRELKKLGIAKVHTHDWLSLAKALFNTAVAKPDAYPIFHLWGHSHEIEKYDMWKELEAFLEHVQKTDVECVTNSAAL